MEKQKTTKRKRLSGTVVSISGNKTAVVKVERKKLHPVYKKRYPVSKKYHAHDEKSAAVLGDKVTIEETRPMSKLKRWRIV